MFDVHSTEGIRDIHLELEAQDSGEPPDPKVKPEAGPAPGSFDSLTWLLSAWSPSDLRANHRQLVSELRTKLEQNAHRCMNACIPSLVVDGQYPIQIMRYETYEDVDEFLSRMMWLQQEFQSAIGVLVGIPDKDTASRIENDCASILEMSEECAVILI